MSYPGFIGGAWGIGLGPVGYYPIIKVYYGYTSPPKLVLYL
jgi:hypothetical protein